MKKAISEHWTLDTDDSRTFADVRFLAPSLDVTTDLPNALRLGMLQAIREERDWTQTELAQQMGVSQQTISAWENAERTPQGLYRRALILWLVSPI